MAEVEGKRKRKRKSVLIPDKLKSNKLNDLMNTVLILHDKLLTEETRSEHIKDQLTPAHLIRTLVRGLGSNNSQVQKNYFAALVTLTSSLENFTFKQLMEVAENEFAINKGTSKGEEGEILMGKVLLFGVLVRSGILSSQHSVDDQTSVFTQLMLDIKGKSYLPLVADPFLVQYLKQVDESVFKKALWPVLRKEIKQGSEQTLLMYHIMLVCEERFPSVLNTKFLKQTLAAPRVLCHVTFPALLNALKGEFKLQLVNHTIFSDIIKYLISGPEEDLQQFWNEVETQFLADSTASKKQIMALKFFNLIALQLQDASKIIQFLTPKLMLWLMKKYKIPKHFKGQLNTSCRETLENLCKLSAKAEDPKTTVSIIKKLLFNPGNVLFEQMSGTKVIHQLIGHLKEKGVVKLVKMLHELITGSSTATEHKENLETVSRPWHNKERLYAVHLFCRLITHPTVQTKFDWRLEQLQFLFDSGFFHAPNIGVELAGQIRESFFSCFSHKLTNLTELQKTLAGIVLHINKRLEQGDQLRIKISSEVMPAWKKMFNTAKKIAKEKADQKEIWVVPVFQTLFYHIGLHLFKEAKFATDVLQELHSVYERVGHTSSSEEEPHWTEVVLEMFLSLLSRNSQQHRNFINCIFVHFCPIMTPQNIHQILQVLDPSSDVNPLLNNLDSDSESSSDAEDESDMELDGENDGEEESSDDGMTDIDDVDDVEDGEEKVNDKLRRAIIDALGDAGATTDVESVDLDNMDEEESKRVDKALSEAFKALKPSKTKKQPSHAKALTHFRTRVLDLIELWLGSEPALDLMVDTLLRLISLLEFSIVDRHQAPLETRLRSVIKKLTSTKKFSTSDCKELNLGSILKSLVDKGERTTTVYMSVLKELTASTVFLVQASQHVSELDTAADGESTTVLSFLKELVDSYFLQRDCLLTASLFQDLFRLKVPLICDLATKLPCYVFDPNVHPFRRSKALEFVMLFWKNNRILSEDRHSHEGLLKKMSKKLYKGSIKLMDEPLGKIQPKYMVLLRKVFLTIQQEGWLSDVDLPKHLQALTEFQKCHVTKGNSNKEKKANGIKHPVPAKDVEDENAKEDLSENSEEEEKMEVDNIENEEEGDENSVEEEDSDDDEPPTKKTKKKSDKKRSHEKKKRVQLLKNNSKKLRLESMNVGLEENVFSQYSLVSESVTSPER